VSGFFNFSKVHTVKSALNKSVLSANKNKVAVLRTEMMTTHTAEIDTSHSTSLGSTILLVSNSVLYVDKAGHGSNSKVAPERLLLLVAE